MLYRHWRKIHPNFCHICKTHISLIPSLYWLLLDVALVACMTGVVSLLTKCIDCAYALQRSVVNLPHTMRIPSKGLQSFLPAMVILKYSSIHQFIKIETRITPWNIALFT